jgi:hypothetical protein
MIAWGTAGKLGMSYDLSIHPGPAGHAWRGVANLIRRDPSQASARDIAGNIAAQDRNKVP